MFSPPALSRRLSAVAAFLLGACRAAPPPSAPPVPTRATLAITGARVFDGEKTLPSAVVLVDGDRIVAVAPDLPIPAGTETVDARGKTLLPGLLDAHGHLWEAGHLEQALAFGVTTVLDMGSVP